MFWVTFDFERTYTKKRGWLFHCDNGTWVDFWVLWLLIVSATRRRGDIKILLWLSVPVRKSLVSNDHGRTHKCDSSVFDWKYPFWANLVKAIKTVSVSWNLVLILIRICRIQWWCSVLTGNTLFGETWPKKSKLSV